MSALIEDLYIKPGIYDMTNGEYHGNKGVSRSAISDLKTSPLDFWMNHLDPNRVSRESTKAMDLGTLVHTLVLEPHLYDQQFAVMKKLDLRRTADKQYLAMFEADNVGKTVIDEETFQKAKSMAKAVCDSYTAHKILNGAFCEKSLFWNDAITGAFCKARPDAWNRNINVIADLKTARSSIRRDFQREITEKNYHIQAAMQIDAVLELTGDKITDFVFIVVQSTPPYKPYIYRLEDEDIQFGREEYRSALKVYSRCLETDDWSRDRDRVQPIFLRPYERSSAFYNLLTTYECE